MNLTKAQDRIRALLHADYYAIPTDYQVVRNLAKTLKTKEMTLHATLQEMMKVDEVRIVHSGKGMPYYAIAKNFDAKE